MARPGSPKWQQEVAIRVAVEVVELVRQHPELQPRLGGAIDRLAVDAEALRNAVSAMSSKRAERKSATARQYSAAERGARQVRAFRRAMRLARPRDSALHRRFGVGERLDVGKVASVAAALQTALDAAPQDPEALAEAGVLPKDLEALRASLDALLGADSWQEATKVGSKHATAERNRVQLRVEAGIGRLLAAAVVVFHDRPAIAAAFEAVVPGRGPGRPHLQAETEPAEALLAA